MSSENHEDMPFDEAKRIIEKSSALKNAKSDQFKEQMRELYLANRMRGVIDGPSERLKIMCDLRDKGGHEAEVADLARYGAIMLHEYVREKIEESN